MLRSNWKYQQVKAIHLIQVHQDNYKLWWFFVSAFLTVNLHDIKMARVELFYESNRVSKEKRALKNAESEHFIGWSLLHLINEIGLFFNPGFWSGASIPHFCVRKIVTICQLRARNSYDLNFSRQVSNNR
jgi:hypothetical protein